MIDINKQIQYWKQGADSDIETAEILISNKKVLQGLFWCHLCLEKIIKAHVAKATKDIPPYSHDLLYLLRKTDIVINDEDTEFLGLMMKYQLEGRYADYQPYIPDNKKVNDYLYKTKELLICLKKKL